MPYTDSSIDQKIVSRNILKTLKTARDFAAYFASDFVTDVNAKHTSTAVVRLAPTVTLSDMPTDATRECLLPRTSATAADSVEVTLTADKYFKVAVDELSTEPDQIAEEIGVAGAEAVVRYGNANLIAAMVSGGTPGYLGDTFDAATTADEVWAALTALFVGFAEDEVPVSGATLFVKPAVWARLTEGVATLRSSVDPRATAAGILGVARVEVTPITGALAIAAVETGAVQARRLIGVRTTQEDFDKVVEGRVKLGSKVLAEGLVRVLLDGAEPVGP